MPQQFNALNGRELKEYILAKVGKAIDNSGEFPQGLTFPWFKYDFKLNVVSYPKMAMDTEEGFVMKGEEKVGEDEPVEEPVKTQVEVKEVIDTPDQARVDSNQPLPTPVLEHGHLVDKPVDIKKLVPPMKGK